MTNRTAARIAWGCLAVFGGLAIVGLWLVVLNGAPENFLQQAFFVVVFVSIMFVGILIVSRQPSNLIGWIFINAAALASVGFVAGEYALYTLKTSPGSLPGGEWAAWLGNIVWIPALFPLISFVPILFPDGRPSSRRWRIVAWAALVVLALGTLTTAFMPGKIDDPRYDVTNPLGIESAKSILNAITGWLFIFLAIVAVAGLVGLLLRYRRASGDDRQRYKWFVYGVAVFIVGFFLQTILADALNVDSALANAIFDLALLGVPIGTGFAILRHQLFDVDVVINRTIVVGALAAFVTVVYVGLVVGLGALLLGSEAGAGSLLTILAAVVIAVAFQPVRAWAQRLANRLVFGKRATPYEVLSDFSDRLGGGGVDQERLLPEIARTVGQGIGATSAFVWLKVGPELQGAGSWPEQAEAPPPLALSNGEVPPVPGADGVYPVRHEGELLGALSFTKPRGERVTRNEDRLVGDLAAQAGLVLRNVRLTRELRANLEELRASRQRIVSAQDAARRRLERNIHDGAQQQLVALNVKLGLARTIAGRDAEKTEALLGDLQQDTQEALENLRDLARGIYPPLLADQGLAAALVAQARKAPIPVSVETDGVGRYPQEVEAAAYFCALEAVQNAGKYGGGGGATITLGFEDGALLLRVADRGPGFDTATVKPGSGLTNMRDRLEALGGTLEIVSAPGSGTVVVGRVPVDSA
jgi:signal transduction histidine kinase